MPGGRSTRGGRRPLSFFTLLLLLLQVGPSKAEHVAHSKQAHSSTTGTAHGVVLVSTIDGQLKALDAKTGRHKWTLHEAPVLRAPTTVKRGFTFLANPQDGSLYTLKDGGLKKLPYGIPRLVLEAPAKGNDGVFYVGSKKDVWLAIDPTNGAKMETLSPGSVQHVCPASGASAVFLGRTEYRLTMFDGRNRTNSWNATFSDYSAHLMPADADYPNSHYAASSSGSLLTVDAATGVFQWAADVGQPIAAVYLLLEDGLHRLPYTVVGTETMDSLVQRSLTIRDAQPDSPPHLASAADPGSLAANLFSTLYVGETPLGLYAMPALVDEHTITYAPKYLGPALIEGQAPLALPDPNDGRPKRPIVRLDHIPTITHKTVDGEFLVLGYHEPPITDYSSLVVPSRPQSVSYPPQLTSETRPVRPALPASANSESNVSREPELGHLVYQIWERHPAPLMVLVATVVALLVATVWMCGRQSGVTMADARSAQTSRQQDASRQFIMTRMEKVPEGWMAVGKVLYNPNEVLGRGCEGTVVYRGRFDGREVAVKRVVQEFVRMVDREVSLLRESDTHPHVIRYFCMESDSQFRYLALELCHASLYDWVTVPAVKERCKGVNAKDLLRQATDGLAHLHSIHIVHRDMKPQNVLLSTNPKGGVKALISDFGLGKALHPGGRSLSRRSGMAGTDGWMAPEAYSEDETIRVTYTIDIFSLGCVFYYVMSEGAHPFGNSLHRQANIMEGHYSLKDLELASQPVEVPGMRLIQQMISLKPEDRPTAEEVLIHPFFWSAEKQLQFFNDVSDRIEKLEETSPIIQNLERNGRSVLRNNWREHICPALTEDLRKFRTYKGGSVRDLMRAMRNKKHHYREASDAVRESLGHIPDQFLAYFTSRFPQLLLHVYEAMKDCACEPVFHSYYAATVRESARRSQELLEEQQRNTPPPPTAEADVWQRGQVVRQGQPVTPKTTPKHVPKAKSPQA